MIVKNIKLYNNIIIYTYTQTHQFTNASTPFDMEATRSIGDWGEGSETSTVGRTKQVNTILLWFLQNMMSLTSYTLRVFGSCCNLFNIGPDKFDMVEIREESLFTRDIDVVCIDGLETRFIEELEKYGEVTLVRKLDLFLRRSRRIKKITDITLHLTKGMGIFSSFLKCLKVPDITVSIKVVSLCKYGRSIDSIMAKWPISDLSMAYTAYLTSYGKVICTQIDVCPFVVAPTSLISIVESMKKSLHDLNNGENRSIDHFHMNFHPCEKLLESGIVGDERRKKFLSSRKTFSFFKGCKISFRVFTETLIRESISRFTESSEVDDTLKELSLVFDNSPTTDEFKQKLSILKSTCNYCVCGDVHPNTNRLVLPCGHSFCMHCICTRIIRYYTMLINRANRMYDRIKPIEGSCPMCNSPCLNGEINISEDDDVQHIMLRCVDITIPLSGWVFSSILKRES